MLSLTVRSDRFGLLYQLLGVSLCFSYKFLWNACLAVPDLEVSMGEKAWLRVRFIPMYERRATGEMIRVERDARAKNRHDQSAAH